MLLPRPWLWSTQRKLTIPYEQELGSGPYRGVTGLLQVHAGKAGLLVTAVGYINAEVPLWYERTLHRPDGREFRCRVTPAQSLRRLHERMIVEKRQLTADELPSPSGDLDGERGTQRDVRGRQS